MNKYVLRSGLSALGLMATMHVVCLIFANLLAAENLLLRVAVSVVVLAIYFIMGYADGAGRGEKAMAQKALVEKQRAGGHEVDERAVEASFAPWKGYAAAAVTAAGAILAAGIALLALSLLSRDSGFSLRVTLGMTMLPYLGIVSALGDGFIWLYGLGFFLWPLCDALSYQTGPKRHEALQKTIAGARDTYDKKQRRERARRKDTVIAPTRQPGKKNLR